MTASCLGTYRGFSLLASSLEADLGAIHRVQVGADEGEHQAPAVGRGQSTGVHAVPRVYMVPPGCVWSPPGCTRSPRFPCGAPRVHMVHTTSANPAWGDNFRAVPTHSLVAAVGDDAPDGGVGAVLEGRQGWELLPIDPQGYRGCAQVGGSGSRASNLPLILAGDRVPGAGGDSGAAWAASCPSSCLGPRDGQG